MKRLWLACNRAAAHTLPGLSLSQANGKLMAIIITAKYATDQSGFGEAIRLSQFRDQQTAPADFFTNARANWLTNLELT